MRPPGRVTRTISLATSNGLGANIAPKTLTDEIEGLVVERGEIGRVAFLEPAVGQAQGRSPSVAGSHEVAGDVDAEHVRAELRSGHRGGPVAAPEVEDVDAGGDPELFDEPLAAVAHGRRDPGEVALLPQRLVRIHEDASFRGLAAGR